MKAQTTDTPEELELVRHLLAKTHRPHMLAKDSRGDLWEFISYPYVDAGDVLVKIRVPGDPCSMITAYALLMDAEHKSPCFCIEAGRDFYLAPEYYRKRTARLFACPARVR